MVPRHYSSTQQPRPSLIIPGVYEIAASAGGPPYHVLVGLDGVITCPCRWHSIRHGNPPCRHEKEVRKLMAEQAETATSQAVVPLKLRPPDHILPSVRELSVIDRLARDVAGARGVAVPDALDTREKVAAVMIAGWELGAPPMTALRHMYIVNGKTEPDAQLMASIVITREPSASFEIVELNPDSCTMRLNRPALGPRSAWEYTYTLEDARRAGLVKPGSNWEKYPKDMLRYAATKRLCRAFAPELVNGMGVRQIGPGGAGEQELPEDEPDYIEGEFSFTELYAEGDEPYEAPPTTDEEESITDATKAQVVKLAQDFLKIVPATEKESRVNFRKGLAERFPRAFKDKSNDVGALTEMQGQQVVHYIETAIEFFTSREPAGDEPATAPAAEAPAESLDTLAQTPDHEHVKVYDEKRTIHVCSVCGVPLEGPDAPPGQLL